MNVRKDFPILRRRVNGKKLVYLDNAATTQKPKQVIDAVTEFYTTHNGNPGRGTHALATEASELMEEARKKVAKFIGSRAKEVIFTNNATHGLNMVAWAYGQGLKRGDEVVMTVMEHHSNYVPWKVACERMGCTLRLADITDDGSLDMEDYKEKISKKTKAVPVVHTSNVLGTVNPVGEMAKIAHEMGAVFILDGAQSVPHMPVDVKRLGCDFMAFSGHKMLAPMGIGVLYGRYDLLEEMRPMITGGGAVSNTFETLKFLEPPHKFEAGTPNVGGAIGLGAAIDYLKKIGMGRIEKHDRKLTRLALVGLSGGFVESYGPNDRAGIISFNIPGIASDEVAAILNEQGIVVRSGQHCAQPLMRRLGIDNTARISFYLYNTKEEIDYTVDVIKKIGSLV